MHISIENASQAFDLSNTHMLITGAAGGIGGATAKLCSQLGAYDDDWLLPNREETSTHWCAGLHKGLRPILDVNGGTLMR